MADPVNVSTSLQNLKCQVQAMAFYQQMTNDTTASAWLATLQTTLTNNEVAGSPPQGYKSALADSQRIT